MRAARAYPCLRACTLYAFFRLQTGVARLRSQRLQYTLHNTGPARVPPQVRQHLRGLGILGL